MATFTALEQAALRSIFSEMPELAMLLEQQFESATVTDRENSGAGFFTTIAVTDDAPIVESARVLGEETQARVVGLEHGLGFNLFMESGRMGLLEGFTWGDESTSLLDLASVDFEIHKAPVRNDASCSVGPLTPPHN